MAGKGRRAYHRGMKTCRIAAVGVMLAFSSLAFANHPVGHSPYLVFRSMDTDGDGQLTREEHVAGSKQLFAAMDTDGNGQVSAPELIAIYALKAGEPGKANQAVGMVAPPEAEPLTPDEMAARIIRQNDTNKDGQLSAAEHAAGDEAMFAKLDTNRDGWLSESECEAGVKGARKLPLGGSDR